MKFRIALPHQHEYFWRNKDGKVANYVIQRKDGWFSGWHDMCAFETYDDANNFLNRLTN